VHTKKTAHIKQRYDLQAAHTPKPNQLLTTVPVLLQNRRGPMFSDKCNMA
jgi:hypothetical protein